MLVPINNGCLYCVDIDLHVLVNNNMLAQEGNCSNKKLY